MVVYCNGEPTQLHDLKTVDIGPAIRLRPTWRVKAEVCSSGASTTLGIITVLHSR